MPRGCFVIAAVLFGVAAILELVGISTFRYPFLFAGLTSAAIGHAI